MAGCGMAGRRRAKSQTKIEKQERAEEAGCLFPAFSVCWPRDTYFTPSDHILQGQGIPFKEQLLKEKIKTFFCILFLICVLPYLITICLKEKNQEPKVEETIADLPGEGDMDVENYLLGVLAAEISVNYEPETIKAQAVIARTNLMAAIEAGTDLPESLSREELQKLWGEEGFTDGYQKLAKAVEGTRGVVMTYQGSYPYAAYHAVSAGYTRSAKEALGNENMPWLEGTDSRTDIPSEDFLKVVFFEKKEFVQRLRSAFGEIALSEENPLENIAVAARDGGEYVLQIDVGGKTVSGEEFRNALELPSACLYYKEVEGKIRIVTKGLGHGLGMSQYGANVLAKGGSSYRDILNYYFKNIEISD